MGPVGAGFEPGPRPRPEEGGREAARLKASADGSFGPRGVLCVRRRSAPTGASIDAYLAGRREAFRARVKPVVVTMLAQAQTAITEAMKTATRPRWRRCPSTTRS